MRFLVMSVLMPIAVLATTGKAFSQCPAARDSLARTSPDLLSGSTQTLGFEQILGEFEGVTALTLRVTDIVRHAAGSDVGVVILTHGPVGFLFEGGPAWGFGTGSTAVLPRFGIGALLGQGGILPELYVGASFMMRLGPTIGFRLDATQRYLNLDRDWFGLTSAGIGVTFLTPPVRWTP